MHFCNPEKPRAPIAMQDVERVRDFLLTEGSLVLGTAKIAAPGVIQMSIGFAKGQGCVQIYTTRLGRSTGNARINVGSLEGLQPVRTGLLASKWFHDALAGAGGPFGGRPAVIFQPEGKLILPPLSSGTPSADVRSVLVTVQKKLGVAGRAAMAKYLLEAGLKEDSEVFGMVKEVFGSEAAKATAQGRKPQKGKKD